MSDQDLTDAGLDPENHESNRALERATPSRKELAPPEDQALDTRWLREIVPLALFQELQMKHEQLLVQYGMVRAGGLRSMELQADLETRDKSLEDAEQSIEQANKRHAVEISRLKQQLREAVLELEARRLEIAALQEKIKALEMMTRNAVTNETIDSQLKRIQEQSRRVEDLASGREAEPSATPPWEPRVDGDQPEH